MPGCVRRAGPYSHRSNNKHGGSHERYNSACCWGWGAVSTAAEMFNPSPNSTGLVMFEHWEQDSKGRPSLLHVSSTLPVTLDPEDVVVRRVWAPAGAPDIVGGAVVVGQEGESRG